MTYFARFATTAGALALSAATTHAAAVQWPDNGHWYDAFVVPAGISWTDANTAATAKGGYLATITSATENTFVFSQISGNSGLWHLGNGPNETGPWIGGRQTDELAEPAGHWAWVTGEAWSYTNWNPGEPNNFFAGEDYLAYHGAGGVPSAVWNDIQVGGHPATGDIITGYVVEFNTQPVPEPATLGVFAVGGLVLARRGRKTANRF